MADKKSTAVEYFIPDHPRTTRNLRGRLIEQIQTETHQVMGGLPNDWADYKHRIGKVRALEMALNMLDDIEKETK